MKRPNLDKIKEMLRPFYNYVDGPFRAEILQLIACIESRGQVRSEEEIREKHKILVDTSWRGRGAETDCGMRWLEWALEDPEPKPDIPERLRSMILSTTLIESRETLIDAAKEIVDLNEQYPAGFPVVVIVKKIDEIIDRLNELTKA